MSFKVLMILVVVLMLTACGGTKIEKSKLEEPQIEEIKSAILDVKNISTYTDGKVNIDKVVSNNIRGTQFYKYYLEMNVTSEFEQLTKEQQYDTLKSVIDSISKHTSYNFKIKCGNQSYCYFDEIVFLTKSNKRFSMSADSDSAELRISGEVSYKPVSIKSNSLTSQSKSSTYTEEELKREPLAPSTNPKDYNKNSEFVPHIGNSVNPEDYSSNGEYKPVKDMTQEEIKQELEDMLGRALGE